MRMSGRGSGFKNSDDMPVQPDPRIQKIQNEPWFRAALADLEVAVDQFETNGLAEGNIYVGTGKLVFGDPLAGAMTEISLVSRYEGLTLLIIKATEVPTSPDFVEQIDRLSKEVRARSPGAVILMLPDDWSFRTVRGAEAFEFVKNLVAFVADNDLEKIGLQKTGQL
jgi:hypothetical protein